MTRLIPAMLLFALLPGCSNAPSLDGGSRGARVSAAPDVHLARYQTYALRPGRLAGDPRVVGITAEGLDRRVAAALTPRLAAKGLRPVTGDEAPDVYVTYLATPRHDAGHVPAGRPRDVGGYDEPGMIPPGQEWGPRDYEEGSLVLQFFDARSDSAPVWRATTRADVTAGERALERALDEALKRYPSRQ